MPARFPVAEASRLAEGERCVVEQKSGSTVIVCTKGVLRAFENRCPHRGAPLAGGQIKDGCLICPWHGMSFDLATGECQTSPGIRLKTQRIEMEDGEWMLESSAAPVESGLPAGIRTALVRYGVTGQVGWFGTIHPLALHRSAQVVIDTALGAWLGEILIGDEETRQQNPAQGELQGEIVKVADADDFEAHALSATDAANRFTTVQQFLVARGHEVIEVEATLDRQGMQVWLLTTPDASLGPTAVELAGLLGLRQVQFLSRSDAKSSIDSQKRYNGSGQHLKSPSKSAREGNVMKGPGLRQRHDFDRIWECPKCQHRERTSGMQTSFACPLCTKKEPASPTFMKLVASPVTAPRKTFQIASNTPVPMPVAMILGDDATRVSRKQAMRPGPSPVAPSATVEADATNGIEKLADAPADNETSLPPAPTMTSDQSHSENKPGIKPATSSNTQPHAPATTKPKKNEPDTGADTGPSVPAPLPTEEPLN